MLAANSIAGPMFRDAINSPARTSSFTALAFAPGALKTGTPRVGHFVDWDIVDPRAGASNRGDRFGDVHVVHFERTQQDGIGTANLRSDFVAVTRQPRETFDRDIVECENLVHVELSSETRCDFSSGSTGEFCLSVLSGKVIHESGKCFDAFTWHRVIDARTNAANASVTLEVCNVVRTSFAYELLQ